MSKQPKKRLCWNCEGNVSVAEEMCPFCGVSVMPATLENGNAHFTPLYQMGSSKEASVPRSPYITEEKTNVPSEEIPQEIPLDDFKTVLLASLLLLSGSVFFVFALVLVLFSQDGLFTLQWDASFWFVYGLLAMPLLFFGWRTLHQIND